jgi:hypothetical protein
VLSWEVPVVPKLGGDGTRVGKAKFIPAAYLTGMERYTQFGIRTDVDEQIRRGFRDAFQRAGLSHQQLLDALGWYRDHGRQLGADPVKLGASFHEFPSARGWQPDQLAVATSAYDVIATQGHAAVLEPTSPETDAEVVARADALLKSDAAAYWRDEALQERALEARERQAAAPAPPSGIDDAELERRIAQQDCDRFAAMLRDPAQAAKYWASAELQQRYRDSLAAAEGPAAEQPAAVPPGSGAPASPAAAPALAVAPAAQPIPVVASPPLAPEPAKP